MSPAAASEPPPAADADSGAASFFQHARNYVLGGVVGGVVGFVSVSVLTRLLTQEEYGVLKVWLAVVSILGVIAELNIRGALNRYYLEETDDFPSFLRTVLTFLAVLSVVNLAWTWLLREPLGEFFNLPPTLLYLAIIAAILEVPWNLNWKLMVARMESGSYSSLRVLRDLLTFAIGAIWVLSLPATDPAVGYGGRELGQAQGLLAVNGAFAVLLLIRLLRVSRVGRSARRHLVYALAFGVPLVPHALSGFILNAFDRIIINQLEGEAKAGLYSFAYDIGNAMNTIVVAMNQAWLPIFMRLRNRDRHTEIHALGRRYAVVICLVALAIVLCSGELAALLGGERFRAALPIIPVVVVSYVFVFLYNLYANHTFYLRATWLVSLATLVAGALNVGLNYWLIPIYGYQIAAWTTLWSYGVLFMLHFWIARGVLRERVTPLLPLVGIVALTGAATWGIVAAEQAIDDVVLSLLVLKLPAFTLLAVTGLRMYRRTRRAAAAPLSDPDETTS